MRKFSSYGQLNTKLHYYAPRKALIRKACDQLLGEDPDEGGHYMTVWAPRQTGKSTVMLEVVKHLRKTETVDVAIITLQSAKSVHTPEGILRLFVKELQHRLEYELPVVPSWESFPDLFTSAYLSKPLILIIDEFDALDEEFINSFANEFRKIYTDRLSETDKKRYLALLDEKAYLESAHAFIQNMFSAEIEIYRADDNKRYDPADRARFAVPLRPAIYVE